MTLFDELVMDALCGPRGRFVPGMPLERLRQVPAQPATVPVPPPVPRTPNVHVVQVATKPNFVVLDGTCPILAGLLEVFTLAFPRLV